MCNAFVRIPSCRPPSRSTAIFTMSKPVHSSKCPRRQKSGGYMTAELSPCNLNRRQWSFTALNSWSGSLSTGFDSRPEPHLNRSPSSSVRVGPLKGDESPPRLPSSTPPFPLPLVSRSARSVHRQPVQQREAQTRRGVSSLRQGYQ